MDLNTTLTVISIGGAAATCIGAVSSQLWKESVEIEGRISKRLTPAGWLALGIALVGLSSSVASELIRTTIENTEQMEAQAAEKRRQDLLDQEARWRDDTGKLLAATKHDIETNLDNTIGGFHKEQEESLQHMHEIILAGQPLTSLSLHLSLFSRDAGLSRTMMAGQEAIKDNADEAQGGVPPVWYDAEEYGEALIPLLSFVADMGDEGAATKESKSGKSGSIIVLLPLDDSANAVLSFGYIAPNSDWSTKGGEDVLSDGFAPLNDEARHGDSIPHVGLRKGSNHGSSKYSIDWSLDSVTLKNAIDRQNPSIPSTAKLPSILNVAILYDLQDIPFGQNNFGKSYAVNLWHPEKSDLVPFIHTSKFSNVTLNVEVNGFREKRYSYILKRVYKPLLLQDDDDPFDTDCTILQFEHSED